MIWQLYAVLWIAIGSASFIFTQNRIDGWEDIRRKPWPQPLWIMISANLMGGITMLFCLYTLYCYYKNRRKGGNKK